MPGREVEIVSRHRRMLGLSGSFPVAMVAACPFPANRGTPIRIMQMGEALARVGLDVHVVTYHLGLDRPVPDAQIHRIRRWPFYREFGAGPTWSKLLILDPLLVIRLATVVRRYRIRVVHAHHFEGALCALAVKRIFGGIRVIYDAHTSLRDELLDYRFSMPRQLKKTAAELLDSWIPRWSDHVVTVSDSLRDFVIDQGVRPENVDVIPMGVNTGEFLNVDPHEARRKHGIGETDRVAVYTGNLAPFQGVDHLLRSWVEVARQAPDARLVIVGRPQSNYEAKARSLGIGDHVTFAGDAPFAEVREYLAAANVVVLPRDNCVGFPLKLLNYMAAGRAIVSFEGSSKEVLHHLESGYLVPDGDESAFARGILHCLNDPNLSERMGSAALRTAREFDMDAVTERVGRLYSDLLPPGTVRRPELVTA